tara:strand:+ start:4382 stop:4612 length:231 start_codon:yes stop_codon:yes gene_type:complete
MREIEKKIGEEKEFTARELMNELKRIDVSIYKSVLDTISDYYNHLLSRTDWEDNRYYAWSDGDDGKMLMYLEGEEE